MQFHHTVGLRSDKGLISPWWPDARHTNCLSLVPLDLSLSEDVNDGNKRIPSLFESWLSDVQNCFPSVDLFCF